MIKWAVIVGIFLTLAGCEQQYRYFCHDPANWKSDRCQKPICEVNRDCPEYILKGTNGNGNSVNLTNLPGAVANTPQQCNNTTVNNNRNVSPRPEQKGVCR